MCQDLSGGRACLRAQDPSPILIAVRFLQEAGINAMRICNDKLCSIYASALILAELLDSEFRAQFELRKTGDRQDCIVLLTGR